MEKKSKWKKNVFIFLGIIFIIFFALVIYGVIIDFSQEDMLKKEIATLQQKDIDKDRYNTAIATKGDYALVEESIKSYLDEFAVSYQELMEMLKNDEKLNSLLTTENYENDGPEFIESREYLEHYKRTFNEKLDKLKKYVQKDYIIQQVTKKNLDSYYVDLYEDLMFGTITDEEWNQLSIDLTHAGNSINDAITSMYKVYDMLEDTQGSWYIQDDNIFFEEQRDVDAYNDLIQQIRKDRV